MHKSERNLSSRSRNMSKRNIYDLLLVKINYMKREGGREEREEREGERSQIKQPSNDIFFATVKGSN